MATRREFLFGRAAAVPGRPVAQVGEACFELQGIVCGNCRDACAVRAVRIIALSAGLAKPVIDPALCTACGDCLPACPAGAISVVPAKPAPERRNRGAGTQTTGAGVLAGFPPPRE